MAELKPKKQGNWRHTGNPVHGLFKGNENLFNLWQTIKNRCENPNRPNYKNYGGRGIKLCAEWQKAENFVRWALSNGYVKGLQIDRINNDGDYEPSNCRFVTCKQNSNNRRNSVRFYSDGECLTAEETAKKYGVSVHTLYYWNRLYGDEAAVVKAVELYHKRGCK